jgi:hypothetical protein
VGDGDVDKTAARMYEHGEVLQLIKSRSDKTKLGIKFETSPGKWERKNYAFPDARQREYFAQLVQRMKITHGDRDAELTSKLRVFIGTFNMGDETPPDDITSWFNGLGMGTVTREAVPYDLYVICVAHVSLVVVVVWVWVWVWAWVCAHTCWSVDDWDTNALCPKRAVSALAQRN